MGVRLMSNLVVPFLLETASVLLVRLLAVTAELYDVKTCSSDRA